MLERGRQSLTVVHVEALPGERRLLWADEGVGPPVPDLPTLERFDQVRRAERARASLDGELHRLDTGPPLLVLPREPAQHLGLGMVVVRHHVVIETGHIPSAEVDLGITPLLREDEDAAAATLAPGWLARDQFDVVEPAVDVQADMPQLRYDPIEPVHAAGGPAGASGRPAASSVTPIMARTISAPVSEGSSEASTRSTSTALTNTYTVPPSGTVIATNLPPVEPSS